LDTKKDEKEQQRITTRAADVQWCSVHNFILRTPISYFLLKVKINSFFIEITKIHYIIV
jgi:hypothetical protein